LEILWIEHSGRFIVPPQTCFALLRLCNMPFSHYHLTRAYALHWFTGQWLYYLDLCNRG